jgi:hypothetical protein
MDSETGKACGYALNFLKGEEIFMGKEFHALLRHAVAAAEIAFVRDGDPGVINGSSEQIDHGRSPAFR